MIEILTHDLISDFSVTLMLSENFTVSMKMLS